MAEITFDEFVRREQQVTEDAERQPVDWAAQKAEWLRHLEELHTMVRQFLQTYVDAKQIVVDYSEVELNEENIGIYKAKVMNISIGRKTIKLEPIGTLLIGSKGRVDVVGPGGTRAQLVLLDSAVKNISQLFHVSVRINGGPPSPPPPKIRTNVEWVWRILTRPPSRSIVEITKESFLALLVEISNG